MKKILPLIMSCLLFATFLAAQNFPRGINYQAVARDADGAIISEKTISLRLSLKTQEYPSETVYVETHLITTNSLGLFNVVIGQGNVISGEFDKVQWDAKNIMMETAMDAEGGNKYKVLMTSNLLAVPYAFHALTANKLGSGDDGDPDKDGPGVPSQNWSLFGNSTSDPDIDKLGTTDLADLVIVTDNIERMRVLEDGDIEIVNSLDIGNDLTVQNNVYLNTDGGQTINNGPLTVANESPTLLTGTLEVDKETNLHSTLTVDGVTDLNSALNVNNASPTTLTGTLRVDKSTNLNDSLTVNNGAPTLLSGKLTVDKATDLNSSLNVDGITDLNSNLNVNNMKPTTLTGTLLVKKDATFNQHVTLDDATLGSTNSADGALVVAGGVGIGENLNISQELNIEPPSISSTTLPKFYVHYDEAKFGVPVKFSSKTSFNAPVEISNANPNEIAETALIVKAKVARGTTGSDPYLNPENTPANHVAHFENIENGNGISIKVGSTEPHSWNNFITFYNSTGGTVGRIEGEDSDCDPQCQAILANQANQNLTAFLAEYGTAGLYEYLDGLSIAPSFFDDSGDFSRNREYMNDVIFASLDVAQGTLGEIFAIANTITAATEGVSVASDARPCVGLGACVTSPGIGRIVVKIANALSAAADLVTATLGLTQDVAALVVLKDTQKALEGITFASGAEDYAEYLPKLDPTIDFLPGEVVGMVNGYITKNTRDASRIMVISHNPAVLGGLPQDDEKDNFEMVAFLGQIPTLVMGKVEPGDYILPSGWNNGYGIAKNPKDMRPSDYKKILGVAWEGVERGLNQINVAVGLNTNDISQVVVQQERDIAELKNQINILAELVPGFKEAAGLTDNTEPVLVTNTPNVKDANGHNNGTISTHIDGEIDFEPIEHQEIVYFEITEEYLNEGLQLAMENARKSGVNMDKHPFWSRITVEEEYKEEVFTALKEELKESFHTHKRINDKFSKD